MDQSDLPQIGNEHSKKPAIERLSLYLRYQKEAPYEMTKDNYNCWFATFLEFKTEELLERITPHGSGLLE